MHMSCIVPYALWTFLCTTIIPLSNWAMLCSDNNNNNINGVLALFQTSCKHAHFILKWKQPTSKHTILTYTHICHQTSAPLTSASTEDPGASDPSAKFVLLVTRQQFKLHGISVQWFFWYLDSEITVSICFDAIAARVNASLWYTVSLQACNFRTQGRRLSNDWWIIQVFSVYPFPNLS